MLTPRWETSEFPAASADNAGIEAYDKTLGVYKFSNGIEWVIFGGNGGLLTAEKTFTAAELDFNTGFNQKQIIPVAQGKVLIVHNIWGKVEFPVSGGALPTNIDGDGYMLGLYSSLQNKYIQVAHMKADVFSTFYVNCYFPLPLKDQDMYLNNHVHNMTSASLRLVPMNDNGSPNNHNGGNYSLKFRIKYELIDSANFI